MYILVIGTPIGGFEFVGPFPDADTAVEYGERHTEDREWWVAKLDKPKG
jgi:hypothetical protein